MRHGVAEAVHEVGEVALALGAEARGVRNFSAVCLVVARAGHVGLAARDGGELVVELLQNRLVRILSSQKIVEMQVPIV